jgi:hypothetical protein
LHSQKVKSDWGCSSIVKCLPGMCEAFSSIPGTAQKINKSLKIKSFYKNPLESWGN